MADVNRISLSRLVVAPLPHLLAVVGRGLVPGPRRRNREAGCWAASGHGCPAAANEAAADRESPLLQAAAPNDPQALGLEEVSWVAFVPACPLVAGATSWKKSCRPLVVVRLHVRGDCRARPVVVSGRVGAHVLAGRLGRDLQPSRVEARALGVSPALPAVVLLPVRVRSPARSQAARVRLHVPADSQVQVGQALQAALLVQAGCRVAVGLAPVDSRVRSLVALVARLVRVECRADGPVLRRVPVGLALRGVGRAPADSRVRSLVALVPLGQVAYRAVAALVARLVRVECRADRPVLRRVPVGLALRGVRLVPADCPVAPVPVMWRVPVHCRVLPCVLVAQEGLGRRFDQVRCPAQRVVRPGALARRLPPAD